MVERRRRPRNIQTEEPIKANNAPANANIIQVRLLSHFQGVIEYRRLQQLEPNTISPQQAAWMVHEKTDRQFRTDRLIYDVLTARAENPKTLPDGIEVLYMSSGTPIHEYSQNSVIIKLPFYRTSDGRIVTLAQFQRDESASRRTQLTPQQIEDARVKLRCRLSSLAEELVTDLGYGNSIIAHRRLLNHAKPTGEAVGDTIRRTIGEIKAIDSAISRQQVDRQGRKRNDEDLNLQALKGPMIYYIISKRMELGSGFEDTFRITRQEDNPQWLRITVPLAEGIEIYTQINLDEIRLTDNALYDQIVSLIGDEPLDGTHKYIPPVRGAKDEDK